MFVVREARPVRHLLFRSGRYYARVAVPPDLRPQIGKREFLEPLGADRRTAISRLHGAVDRFKLILAAAREGGCVEAAGVSIAAAAQAHFASELEDGERTRYSRAPTIRRELPCPSGERAYLHALRKIAGGHIGKRDWEDVEKAQRLLILQKAALSAEEELRTFRPADGILTNDEMRAHESLIGTSATVAYEMQTQDTFIEATIGWAIDVATRGTRRPVPGTSEYLELAKALAAAQVDAIEINRQRDAQDYSGTPRVHSHLEYSKCTGKPERLSLNTLFDEYIALLARGGSGAGASQRWRPVIGNLIGFLGHDNAHDVTAADLRRWETKLREGLAEKTIKDVYFAAVKTIYGFACNQGMVAKNPAQGLKIKMSRRIESRGKEFTRAEAISVLRLSLSYEPKQSSNPATQESAELTEAKRWVPMLCAYTGARVAEITQLRKEDVRCDDGIWYIRITPDAGSVKTGRFRDVPLHSQLLSLGFVDFVAARRDGPLFFRVQSDRKGVTHPSKTVAGRLSEWLRSTGAVPKDVSPNHAWRHTFKTSGIDAGMEVRVIDAIQGHAPRTAGESYGHVSLKTKAREIEKMPPFLTEPLVTF